MHDLREFGNLGDIFRQNAFIEWKAGIGTRRDDHCGLDVVFEQRQADEFGALAGACRFDPARFELKLTARNWCVQASL